MHSDTMNRIRQFWSALPIAVLTAVLQGIFIYGYTRAFSWIEASSPKNFERNASHALESNNKQSALAIGRSAIDSCPTEPMAYTVYAKALFAAGEQSEAISQLYKALNITEEIVDGKSKTTRKPFYFSPARLMLGHHLFESNQPILALYNFELARSTQFPSEFPADFLLDDLYAIYARYGLWSRALVYGQPSENELAHLNSSDLLAIIAACAETDEKQTALRIALELSRREINLPELDFIRGRLALHENDYDGARTYFEKSAAGGYDCSEFYLGFTLEKLGLMNDAMRAYERVPADDFSRAFAFARAALLTMKINPDERSDTALLNDLDNELARLGNAQPPQAVDKYLRYRPLAFNRPTTKLNWDLSFPVLILWQDQNYKSTDELPVSVIGTPAESSSFIRRGNLVLQLQFTRNLLNWDIVDKIPVGRGPIPGWIDTSEEWFDLHPNHAARVDRDNTLGSIINIDAVTWLYSNPIRTRSASGYFLTGRVKSQSRNGRIGWQALISFDEVANEALSDSPNQIDQWEEKTMYIKSRAYWNWLRVQLNVVPFTGSGQFDDVTLIEIQEPDVAI